MKWIAGLAAGVLFTMGAGFAATSTTVVISSPLTNLRALADIPAEILHFYQDAAQTQCPGMSWTVLAAIGKIETNHGQSQLPGVHSGTNSAGAMGPMQFLAATWAAFHLPGLDDPYDPKAAVYAAARYLCSNGAATPEGLSNAIWHYNHAGWYVRDVMAQAARYLADAASAAQQAATEVGTAIGGIVRAGNPFGAACHPVLTQGFGPTDFGAEPAVFGYAHFHTGIDLACPGGTPVHTLTDGVAHVTTGWGGGFGNNVVVEVTTSIPGIGSGHWFVRYAHLQSVLVGNGAAVHAGDLVGLEGTTGNSTGNHLHLEVDHDAARVANAVSPAALLGGAV